MIRIFTTRSIKRRHYILKIRPNTQWIKLTLTLLLISGLWGCDTYLHKKHDGKDSNNVHYRTQVNFIGQWLNEGDREFLVRNLARDYEFKNQDIHINLKFPEEVYYKREDNNTSNQRWVAEQVQKEVGEWDILRINNDFEGILAQIKDPQWAKKYLVDLSNYDEIKKNTLPELLSDSIKRKWNGIIPGPFIEGQYWSMWCNKTLAEKIGIKVKPFGVTFEDFESYCAAAYKYNLSHPTEAITTIFEAGDWQTLSSFTTQLYNTVLNDDEAFFSDIPSQKKLNAWFETLRLLERLAKYKPLAKDWKSVAWGKTMGIMLEDKFLFYPNGSWMYNIWKQRGANKVTDIFPTEYASVNPPKSYPGGYVIMWAIPKNAPHKEEAIKFLLSFSTPSFSELWVRTTKCPTGVTGNLTKIEFGDDAFETFTSTIQKNYGIRLYTQDAGSARQYGLINIDVPSYNHEVITGELTADEAIRLIKAQLK